MAAVVRFCGCKILGHAVQLAPMDKRIHGSDSLHACAGRKVAMEAGWLLMQERRTVA